MGTHLRDRAAEPKRRPQSVRGTRARRVPVSATRPIRRLTVVLPTRNEVANVSPMIRALLALPMPGVTVSVLVVDYASTDGTVAAVERLRSAHPGRVGLEPVSTPGLGPAYLAGFRRALDEGADLVGQMDCDFSHEPAALVAMLARLDRDGVDAVFGSRWMAGGTTTEEWSPYRRLLSVFANGRYVKALLRLPLADATGGFRLWRRQTLLGMGLSRVTSRGYVFQVEMASVAHRLGYALAEIPIRFGKRR